MLVKVMISLTISEEMFNMLNNQMDIALYLIQISLGQLTIKLFVTEPPKTSVGNSNKPGIKVLNLIIELNSVLLSEEVVPSLLITPMLLHLNPISGGIMIGLLIPSLYLIKISLKDITLSPSSDLKISVMDIWIVDSLLMVLISYLVNNGTPITLALKLLVTKLLYIVIVVIPEMSPLLKVPLKIVYPGNQNLSVSHMESKLLSTIYVNMKDNPLLSLLTLPVLILSLTIYSLNTESP